MKRGSVLVASAASLEELAAAARRFYFGTEVRLSGSPEQGWRVVRVSDAKNLDHLFVELRRGRYRLMMFTD